MSDEQTYDALELVGYRVPDFSVEPRGDGTHERIELPGIYRVGVLIDGQFVEVTAFKAGLLQNSAAQAAKGRERDRKQAAQAEQQLREQEAAEQQLREQEAAEQQLREQEAAEQQLREQEAAEQQQRGTAETTTAPGE